MSIAVAHPEERWAALAVLFDRLDRAERDRRVAFFLDAIAAGEMDPDGLLAASAGGRIRGAIAGLPMPGASALVWPPGGDAATFPPLVDALIARFRRKGIKLAQAIVDESDADALEPLASRGFVAAGPMEIMRHSLDEASVVDGSANARLIPLNEAPEAVLAETLERTYRGTLDFPELAGARTIGDVMASFRGNRDFRWDRGRLALVGDEPAGILALTEVEAFATWDLTYLGVVPEMRRRGIGRTLVLAALGIVAEAGGASLDVAVDARNVPAIQLYRTLGFQLVVRRRVSLFFLAPPADSAVAP